jgi:hypothetical protein
VASIRATDLKSLKRKYVSALVVQYMTALLSIKVIGSLLIV